MVSRRSKLLNKTVKTSIGFCVDMSRQDAHVIIFICREVSEDLRAATLTVRMSFYLLQDIKGAKPNNSESSRRLIFENI